jgi:hypothetical protein
MTNFSYVLLLIMGIASFVFGKEFVVNQRYWEYSFQRNETSWVRLIASFIVLIIVMPAYIIESMIH